MVRAGVVTIVLAGGVLALGAWGPAGAGSAADELPDAVRTALAHHLGGGEPDEIERELENGVVVYGAEWTVDGREHEVELTEQGDLVEREDELSADEVSAVVRGAAATLLGDGAVEYERRVFVSYEASVRVDGRRRRVFLSPTGAIVQDHDDDGDDDDGDGGDDEDDDGEEDDDEGDDG